MRRLSPAAGVWRRFLSTSRLPARAAVSHLITNLSSRTLGRLSFARHFSQSPGLSIEAQSIRALGKYTFQEPNPDKPRPEIFIDTPAQLEELLPLLAPHPVLGVDTEFIDMPYYRPRLEVLQISSPEVMAAIDCQRLSMHLKTLLEMILEKELILHSCQSDLHILYDQATRFGLKRKLPRRLFDTQIAAAFLGKGPMVAFKKLLSELFGIELDKSDTLTDWAQRPLTEKQIQYAINDVRTLHAIRDHLTAELKEAGRYEWYLEELAAYENEVFFQRNDSEHAWRTVWKTKSLPDGLSLSHQQIPSAT